MAEFLEVKTEQEVLAIIRRFASLPSETVDLDGACGRVLATDVVAPEAVPPYSRATMDGYAVQAKNTYGATESLPALLELMGEVHMDDTRPLQVAPGTAVAIPTGGMLPDGADAVVMVEYSQHLDEHTIEITRPVAPGDHVIKPGEDIALGEAVFTSGRRLRPQDVGVLAALGISGVSVHRRPLVAVLSTGDEVVPVATAPLPPGRIRDINTHVVAALVREVGATVGATGLIPDDPEALVAACRQALADHDVVLLSGGSSVGVRDYTLDTLKHLPDSEVMVHGVAVKPGKPTILARVGDKLFWGLPGQPASAMMVVMAFVLPSLARLEGVRDIVQGTSNTRRAVLSQRLSSVHGRADYIPVTLSTDGDRPKAVPLFGKSAMISILARADGYIRIPEHVEGLYEGTEVTVYLFSLG